jgi:hypothetical protein
MYINLSVFTKSQLLFSDLIFLCAISQTETTWLIENLTEDIYERFKAISLVKHIKTKNKKEHSYESLRLSESGKTLLSQLEEAEVEEQDERIFLLLENHYRKLGKDIGNKSKTKRHIRDFRVKGKIEKNNLINLVLDFLQENEDKSKRLEYIFYYPKTAFETKFNLDGSWLWNHFEKNKERISKTFIEY